MKVLIALILLFSHSLTTNADFELMVDSEAKVKAAAFHEGETKYLDAYYVQGNYLSVKGMEITGFEGESLSKMNQALEVLERVVNSEDFKSRVVNFKNKKGERAFASNKGMSNEDIYATFMEGRETLQPNTPGEMNFFLKLYNKSSSKVVGYTSPSSNLININWKFFKNFKPSDVAGNLAHEWTHKIGFGHKSASEHDSAPYAIGYIVNELAVKYLKNRELN